MGLGLAVSLPNEKITVLDGDGSVLMNLGSLSTLARYRPPNLTHWIFDNESLLSVGGFPTATGTGTDLAGIAEKAGAEHVALADTIEAVEETFAEASERNGMSVIVSKVEAVGPASFAMDISLLENRFEFARHLAGLAGG
jgi:sulfopyruvate decarboxylase subunit beta